MRGTPVAGPRDRSRLDRTAHHTCRRRTNLGGAPAPEPHAYEVSSNVTSHRSSPCLDSRCTQCSSRQAPRAAPASSPNTSTTPRCMCCPIRAAATGHTPASSASSPGTGTSLTTSGQVPPPTDHDPSGCSGHVATEPVLLDRRRVPVRRLTHQQAIAMRAPSRPWSASGDGSSPLLEHVTVAFCVGVARSVPEFEEEIGTHGDPRG
jgi:hypothetical protein